MRRVLLVRMGMDRANPFAHQLHRSSFNSEISISSSEPQKSTRKKLQMTTVAKEMSVDATVAVVYHNWMALSR